MEAAEAAAAVPAEVESETEDAEQMSPPAPPAGSAATAAPCEPNHHRRRSYRPRAVADQRDDHLAQIRMWPALSSTSNPPEAGERWCD